MIDVYMHWRSTVRLLAGGKLVPHEGTVIIAGNHLK